MNATPELFAKIGRSLPERQRIQGTSSMKVKIEPTGGITLNRILDTFLDGKVDATKNNLEAKKVVLIFGEWSNPLTRTFYIPKLHSIYHYMTLQRDDVEFLFVSLDGTEQDFNKMKSIMRKFYSALVVPGFMLVILSLSSFAIFFYHTSMALCSLPGVLDAINLGEEILRQPHEKERCSSNRSHRF